MLKNHVLATKTSYQNDAFTHGSSQHLRAVTKVGVFIARCSTETYFEPQLTEKNASTQERVRTLQNLQTVPTLSIVFLAGPVKKKIVVELYRNGNFSGSLSF